MSRELRIANRHPKLYGARGRVTEKSVFRYKQDRLESTCLQRVYSRRFAVLRFVARHSAEAHAYHTGVHYIVDIHPQTESRSTFEPHYPSEKGTSQHPSGSHCEKCDSQFRPA